jgi:hypothetical protein
MHQQRRKTRTVPRTTTIASPYAGMPVLENLSTASVESTTVRFAKLPAI